MTLSGIVKDAQGIWYMSPNTRHLNQGPPIAVCYCLRCKTGYAECNYYGKQYVIDFDNGREILQVQPRPEYQCDYCQSHWQ
jgi:hypothetical protein